MDIERIPVPDDIFSLRRQNASLRTINHALEAELAIHRAKARQYHEAVCTLSSEREANARLTEEIERLASPTSPARDGHRPA